MAAVPISTTDEFNVSTTVDEDACEDFDNLFTAAAYESMKQQLDIQSAHLYTFI